MAEALQNPVVLAAILTAVVGPAAAVLLNWAANQRKSRAGATRDVAEARHSDVEGDVSVAGVVLRWSEGLRDELAKVKTEVAGLKAQIRGLEDEIAVLRKENSRLRAHNAELSAQVQDLGGVPRAMLPE